MNNLDLEYTEGIFPGTREELIKKVKESVKEYADERDVTKVKNLWKIYSLHWSRL